MNGNSTPNAGNRPEEFVVFCGSIKPFIIPEEKEEEKNECTEQS